MVTHDVARSLDVCSKAIFLHEGKIAFEGAPEAMRASTSPLIAGFLSGKGGLGFATPTAWPGIEAETKAETEAATPTRPDDPGPNIKEGRP